MPSKLFFLRKKHRSKAFPTLFFISFLALSLPTESRHEIFIPSPPLAQLVWLYMAGTDYSAFTSHYLFTIPIPALICFHAERKKRKGEKRINKVSQSEAEARGGAGGDVCTGILSTLKFDFSSIWPLALLKWTQRQ